MIQDPADQLREDRNTALRFPDAVTEATRVETDMIEVVGSQVQRDKINNGSEAPSMLFARVVVNRQQMVPKSRTLCW